MKNYIKPEIIVVRLQPQGLLMQLSNVDKITGNADLILGGAGGGTVIPRAQEQNNIWDEEW